jgi:16S rRNA (cytidine1402-2'-O)-methyltransferase
MTGKLYICATPIGNLEDITLRVLKTLENVDLIAAEDTRHTIKLLNHFEIKNKLFSYHEHNKATAGPHLIEMLAAGKNIALVSDAGMPGISDPGEELIKLALQASVDVEALPGASAVITALAGSGLSTRKFFFEGFLDRQKKHKKKRLESIKNIQETLVFYESPHRLLETLKEMSSIFGNRKVVIAREITKKFEEYFRGSLEDAWQYFKDKGVKGEFVVLVEGNTEEVSQSFSTSIEEDLKRYIIEGNTKKEAISIVATERSIPKKQVYQVSIDLEY